MEKPNTYDESAVPPGAETEPAVESTASKIAEIRNGHGPLPGGISRLALIRTIEASERPAIII